jgi:hypothetical protein
MITLRLVVFELLLSLLAAGGIVGLMWAALQP